MQRISAHFYFFSLSLSPFLSPLLPLPLLLYLPLPSLSLSPSLFLSLCYLNLPYSLSLSLSPWYYLSFFFSIFLSLLFSLFYYLSLLLSISVNISLSFSLSLSLLLYFSLLLSYNDQALIYKPIHQINSNRESGSCCTQYIRLFSMCFNYILDTSLVIYINFITSTLS